jgi:hypothetical protein
VEPQGFKTGRPSDVGEIAKQLLAVIDLAVPVAVHSEEGEMTALCGPRNLFFDSVTVQIEADTMQKIRQLVILPFEGPFVCAYRQDDWVSTNPLLTNLTLWAERVIRITGRRRDRIVHLYGNQQ